MTAYRAATGFLTAFIALRLLGADTYGNVATLMALFALGLPLVSSVFIVLVARASKPQENHGIANRSAVFLAASMVATAFAVLIMGLAVGLQLLLAEVHTTMPVGRGLWEYFQIGGSALGILTALQIYSALNSAMIESVGRLDVAMKSQLTGPFIVLVALSSQLLLATETTAISYLFLLCGGAATDLIVLWIVRRVLIRKSLSYGHMVEALKMIPELLKSGFAIQFASLMNVFLEPLNKLVLNHFVGAASVASYDLAMKVIWGLQGLFGAIMRVFLHLTGQGTEVIKQTYIRFLSLFAVPVLIAHAFGAMLLMLALHSGLDIDRHELMLFYGVATLSNLTMIYITPLYISLIGKDDRRFLLQNQLRLTVSNIVGSLLLIPLLGLIGSAVGLLVASMYNSYAIYKRFEHLAGKINAIWRQLAARAWPITAGITLLVAALVAGWGLEVEIWWVAVLSGAMLLTIAFEPITVEVMRRLAIGASGKQ